jgi:hypothetical protein
VTEPGKPDHLTEEQRDAVLRLAGLLNQLGVNPVSFLADAVTAESEAMPILVPKSGELSFELALASLLAIRPVPLEQVDLLRAPSVLSAIEEARSRAPDEPWARKMLATVARSIAGKYPRGKPRSWSEYEFSFWRYGSFLAIWDEVLKAIGRPPRIRRGLDARVPRVDVPQEFQEFISRQVAEHKNASEMRRLSKEETQRRTKQGRGPRRFRTPTGLPTPKALAAMVFVPSRSDDPDGALAEIERLRKFLSRPLR